MIDVSTAQSITLNGSDVSKITEGGVVLWDKMTHIDYLCFTDASGYSNTLTLTKNDQEGNTPTVTLEYSTDKVNWTTWTETNNVRTYTIPANGKVYLRGVNPNGICYNGRNCHTFSSTKNVRASGNIMTIADGIGRRTEITRPFFARLFYQMTTLLTAPNFPSEGMSLGDSSLAGLFNGCSSLTTAPSLTVNSLSSGWCCQLMFNECTSLTDASTVHLNATNIPSSAYMQMFNGCTSLVTSPSLIISSMSGTNACNSMFKGCTSLTSASNITLNATTIPNSAYEQMFNECSALVSAPTITSSALTIGDRGLQQLFRNCTSLTTAPNLNIATLNSSGTRHCNETFNGCTNLTNVTNIKLNATTLYVQSYRGMFMNCTSLVTPPEIKATTLTYTSGSAYTGSLTDMFYNCSKISTIKVHFTDWGGGNSTQRWTYGTKSSGTFYKPSSLPSTKNTSGNTSYAHYIPYNWTVVLNPCVDCTNWQQCGYVSEEECEFDLYGTLNQLVTGGLDTRQESGGTVYKLNVQIRTGVPECTYTIREAGGSTHTYSGSGDNSLYNYVVDRVSLVNGKKHFYVNATKDGISTGEIHYAAYDYGVEIIE